MYPSMLFPGKQPKGAELGGFEARFQLRWWSPWSWWLVGRRVRNADLIVLPWVTPFHALPLRVLLAAARGVPAVAIVHNPDPHESMPFARSALRLFLRRCSGALVHADVLAERLLEITSVERVEVTPHPPNLAIEPSALPSRPPLRLLMAGFVREYKGADLAIDAVVEARQQGIEVSLTVAGDFWEPVEKYRAQVEARDAAAFVELRPGYLGDEMLLDLLREHHALIAPYRAASVSGVVPLALAAGRPVVATPVGGLVESVSHGVSGVLATRVDATALADAIVCLNRDVERLASSGPRYAGDWTELAEALLRLLGKPVSRP